MAVSLLLFPQLGPRFLPAGRCRPDAAACARAAGHAHRGDAGRFRAKSKPRSARSSGNDQIDTMLDNIGLPYSGINIALERFGDRRPDGWRNPDFAEEEASRRPPSSWRKLRRELPKRFPELQFFFQPADIVDQVLNFGQPAPIDIRVSGPDSGEAYALASKTRARSASACRASWTRMCSRCRMRPRSTSMSTARWPSEFGLESANRPPATCWSRPIRSAQTCAELLGRSAQQRQLSAGRADADLPHRLDCKICGPCR